MKVSLRSALLSLLVVIGGSARSADMAPEAAALWAKAFWAPITEGTDSKVYIDQASFVDEIPDLSVWSVDKKKDGSLGYMVRWDIQCNLKQWRTAIWIDTSGLLSKKKRYELSQSGTLNIDTGTVIDQASRKLCGIFIPAIGKTAKFLGSIEASSPGTYYYLAEAASRSGSIVTLDIIAQTSPFALIDPQLLSADQPSYSKLEIDCNKNMMRVSAASAAWGAAKIDKDTQWVTIDTTLMHFPARRRCADQRIPAIDPPQPDLASHDGPSGSSQSTALSLEDAKQKCADLGFKAATEDFGKCVLQLSR